MGIVSFPTPALSLFSGPALGGVAWADDSGDRGGCGGGATDSAWSGDTTTTGGRGCEGGIAGTGLEVLALGLLLAGGSEADCCVWGVD
jgi:hypothetical protein